MCFSAVASFGAGSVLCVAGVMTTQKVQSKVQLAFAVIPFLFGVQQFADGDKKYQHNLTAFFSNFDQN